MRRTSNYGLTTHKQRDAGIKIIFLIISYRNPGRIPRREPECVTVCQPTPSTQNISLPSTCTGCSEGKTGDRDPASVPSKQNTTRDWLKIIKQMLSVLWNERCLFLQDLSYHVKYRVFFYQGNYTYFVNF